MSRMRVTHIESLSLLLIDLLSLAILHLSVSTSNLKVYTEVVV